MIPNQPKTLTLSCHFHPRVERTPLSRHLASFASLPSAPTTTPCSAFDRPKPGHPIAELGLGGVTPGRRRRDVRGRGLVLLPVFMPIPPVVSRRSGPKNGPRSFQATHPGSLEAAREPDPRLLPIRDLSHRTPVTAEPETTSDPGQLGFANARLMRAAASAAELAGTARHDVPARSFFTRAPRVNERCPITAYLGHYHSYLGQATFRACLLPQTSPNASDPA